MPRKKKVYDPSKYIVNPDSGRHIAIGGPTWFKLIKAKKIDPTDYIGGGAIERTTYEVKKKEEDDDIWVDGEEENTMKPTLSSKLGKLSKKELLEYKLAIQELLDGSIKEEEIEIEEKKE